MAAPFETGGAAGYIEEVTWDNKLVWNFNMLPWFEYLTHHDIEPMPNGNVLLLCWQRISKEKAIMAGRNPKYIPQDEVLGIVSSFYYTALVTWL